MRERDSSWNNWIKVQRALFPYLRYLLPLGRVIGEICPKESFLLAYFLSSLPCIRNAEEKKTSVWMKSKQYLKAREASCWDRHVLNLLNFNVNRFKSEAGWDQYWSPNLEHPHFKTERTEITSCLSLTVQPAHRLSEANNQVNWNTYPTESRNCDTTVVLWEQPL